MIILEVIFVWLIGCGEKDMLNFMKTFFGIVVFPVIATFIRVLHPQNNHISSACSVGRRFSYVLGGLGFRATRTAMPWIKLSNVW